jgi:hypothetical protein
MPKYHIDLLRVPLLLNLSIMRQSMHRALAPAPMTGSRNKHHL